MRIIQEVELSRPKAQLLCCCHVCRLTHPCPGNPLRTRADEDAWYVEPTLEQRQLAMALDIPLYGIC